MQKKTDKKNKKQKKIIKKNSDKVKGKIIAQKFRHTLFLFIFKIATFCVKQECVLAFTQLYFSYSSGT